MARRGHPREVLWQPSSNGFRLSGWHDGYRRLPGRPKHSRAFKWHQEGLLLVRDEVEAACPLRAVVRLHMHPACEVSRVDADAAVIWTPAGEVFLRFAGAGELVLESGWYCPEFGRRVSNPVLAWHAVGPRVCSAFSLSLGRSPEEFDVTHGATLGGQRYGW